AFLTRVTVSSPSSGVQSETAILAPSLEKISAAARPWPLPAPVMIATLLLRRILCSAGDRTKTPFEAGPSGRRDDAFGRSLKNLSHYLGARRADQRILADKEGRHTADRALTRRQRVVFQPQLVARCTNCLRDFVFVEAALGPETRDQFRIADVRAL